MFRPAGGKENAEMRVWMVLAVACALFVAGP
jgi:hypothetical protein